MDTIETIKSRRSVRGFTDENVSDGIITQILEAGRWAPSGLNNQAWRFIIVRDSGTKVALSNLTKYGPTIKKAPVLIVVFLDKDHMYHYVKDVQSIGACIQNMLLAIHSLGLGGVWLGEILENKEKVNKVLGAPDSFELMAVVALGHPVDKKRLSERKELDQLIFREKFGKSW
ncbi:MAG: nitroreductase family protein [Candidatus Methanoperedens sp.]|nr:nitroreductase family protein [Candidatus Methanoperedens sp.]